MNLNRTFHVLRKPDILMCYQQMKDFSHCARKTKFFSRRRVSARRQSLTVWNTIEEDNEKGAGRQELRPNREGKTISRAHAAGGLSISASSARWLSSDSFRNDNLS